MNQLIFITKENYTKIQSFGEFFNTPLCERQLDYNRLCKNRAAWELKKEINSKNVLNYETYLCTFHYNHFISKELINDKIISEEI